MEKPASFELNNIHLKFENNTYVFRDLNLKIKSEENLAILGRGGVGKTSLCKLIMGLIPNYTGDYFLFGENFKELHAKKKAEFQRKMSMSFQQGALFDFMTVRENIEFALENLTDVPKKEYVSRVDFYLDKIDLKNTADKYPNELSGGMRRRVGIVRSLISRPSLVLFDEPTTGLDPITSLLVLDLIRNLGKEVSGSIICMTSIVEIAFDFSKQVAILEDGKIIGRGTKEELHALNNPFIEKFLKLRKIDL